MQRYTGFEVTESNKKGEIVSLGQIKMDVLNWKP